MSADEFTAATADKRRESSNKVRIVRETGVVFSLFHPIKYVHPKEITTFDIDLQTIILVVWELFEDNSQAS